MKNNRSLVSLAEVFFLGILLLGFSFKGFAEDGATGDSAAAKPALPAGPVADTVLSPLGGYGTAPPPETGPYDAPDFSPVTKLNEHLPRWIQFGLEERLRWEMPSGAGFKPHNDDSYLLNRLRFGLSLRPTTWFGVIRQGGSAGSNDISAWATTLGVGYRFSSLRGVPRIFAGYDFASGDKNPTDGVHNTFDLMYPNAHDRFGIADQIGWQNIVSYRGGVTVRVHRRLFVVGQYLDFWLANAKDGLYKISGGLVARDKTGMSETHVGRSLETYAWYELNRRISFGAGVAHIFPGEFLLNTTQGAGYTYPYVVLNFLDGKKLLEVP